MRDALDDSELYLNDDEDGVCFKRRNLEPAPKVIILLIKKLKLMPNFTDSRSKMGKIRLRSNKGPSLLDTFGSSDIKKDHASASLAQLLFK